MTTQTHQVSEQLELKAIIDALRDIWRNNPNASYPFNLADGLASYRNHLIEQGAVVDMTIWDYTRERLDDYARLDTAERVINRIGSIGDILDDLKYLIELSNNLK